MELIDLASPAVSRVGGDSAGQLRLVVEYVAVEHLAAVWGDAQRRNVEDRGRARLLHQHDGLVERLPQSQLEEHVRVARAEVADRHRRVDDSLQDVEVNQVRLPHLVGADGAVAALLAGRGEEVFEDAVEVPRRVALRV